jgi:putative MATE family efflux protein
MIDRKRRIPGGIYVKLNARAFDREQIDWDHLMFTGSKLWKLLIPLMIEQLLASLMGMADTMMVSRLGSAEVSAVSLSDSINNLVIQAFAALATGGTIICSQYIGRKDRQRANRAAEQVMFACFTLSFAVGLVCFLLRGPILSLVFGSVSDDVMRYSLIYFAYTSVSFPFIALYQSGSAFFRAGGNSRFPMTISVISNVLNIIGNAIFMFLLHMGVAGAALSTLLSRAFCAIVIFGFLRRPKQEIVIRHYLVKPDWKMIKKVLSIGIPSGVENSMFQFGKLAIQSSVSTLGTASIAAQAMTNIMEHVNGVGAIGVGIGLMTIVGQAIGAGKKEEAKYYILRLMDISETVIIISCLLVFALAKPVIWLAGMEAFSGKLCFYMISWITLVKPLIWTPAFIIAYGMRASGDVRFSMIVSSCTMWMCRVILATILIRGFGMGPMAVWIGMFSDWFVRGVIYLWRYRSMKWLRHEVI